MFLSYQVSCQENVYTHPSLMRNNGESKVGMSYSTYHFHISSGTRNTIYSIISIYIYVGKCLHPGFIILIISIVHNMWHILWDASVRKSAVGSIVNVIRLLILCSYHDAINLSKLVYIYIFWDALDILVLAGEQYLWIRIVLCSALLDWLHK